MKKSLSRFTEKTWVFLSGVLLLLSGIFLVSYYGVADPSIAAKLLSMVAASHLGGRLAFISVGLEFQFPTLTVIGIVILYNTTYLLLMYSLVLYMWKQTTKLRIVQKFVESTRGKAQRTTQVLKKWSWLGLALYVWIPLPWTGAVMGSVVANIEGYNTKNTLVIVIPSMWIGVVTWTIWFDELYGFIERFGRGKTLFLTLFIVFAPLVYYLVKRFIKRNTRRLPAQ